jgi:hypothetical protein
MADNIPYTTTGDTRWDTIAQKAYGKASAFQPIISANPNVPITALVPGGTVLLIPILENNSILTDAESLPPWKR